jgi:trans-2,3-dihydro-3-hydroxyanthranilate isomerase
MSRHIASRCRHRYRLVDVFTREIRQGNPLAVFPDARGIDVRHMQVIARGLNIPETAFVVASTRDDCVAGVRIFTPTREMPFGGHPTIGTAYILLVEKRLASSVTELCLEERVGAVPVRVERSEAAAVASSMLWLRTPAIRWERTYEANLCAKALGLHVQDLLDSPPQRLTAGNPTLLIAVRDPETVDRVTFSAEGMRRLRGNEAEPFCVFVFAPTPTGAYARMFAPDFGIPEDPASGSSTGPLAAYMMKHGLVAAHAGTWISEQGTRMGRRCLLHVRTHGYQGVAGIEIGGYVGNAGDGVIELSCSTSRN